MTKLTREGEWTIVLQGEAAKRFFVDRGDPGRETLTRSFGEREGEKGSEGCRPGSLL